MPSFQEALMKSHRRIRRSAAIALAALGLAVPAAQARLVDPPLGHSGPKQGVQSHPLSPADAYHFGTAPRRDGTARPVVAPPRPTTVKSAGDGLDLGSIAVGAGGFLALVALGAAGNAAVAARRGRVHAVR
jgi:hypothetical protein